MTNYDLDNPEQLRRLIVRLTDGVWNSEDTAGFDEDDIAIINRIRNYTV